MEQADVAIAVWRATVGKDADSSPLHVSCHDMGNTVAQEILARRQRSTLPEFLQTRIASLTLNNGGVIQQLHSPRISQILLRIPVIGPFVASLMVHSHTLTRSAQAAATTRSLLSFILSLLLCGRRITHFLSDSYRRF
jgi:hypothetical protein